MAFELYKTIDNVRRFKATDSFLITATDRRCTVISQHIDTSFTIGFDPYKIFRIDDERFLLTDIANGDAHLYSVKDGSQAEQVKLFGGSFIAMDPVNKIMLFMKYGNDGGYHYSAVDIDGKLLWESNDFTGGIYYFINNKVIRNSKGNVISCNDVLDGTVLWTFSLSHFGPWTDRQGKQKNVFVNSLLGAYQSDFWIGLNNGKVLLLDLETGNQKAIIGDPYFNYSYLKEVFPATGAMRIDHRKNVVIGLFMSSYWEVDTKTLSVSHYDMKEHFNACQIYSFGDFDFDDQYIYFYDKDNCKIALFDRGERMVKWQYTLKQRNEVKVFPMELQKHGDNLYVLDNMNTLHIFNKIL